MASDARPGTSRHFRGGLLEDDHVYVALMRERDEAREAAGHLRDSLERLTKAVHNWNVALEVDDAGEIYAVNCELEAAVIAADEELGGWRAMTADPTRDMHIGRSWPNCGHRLEDECPCPQEPCGLVALSRVDPECPQHALTAFQTMRQSHFADECPGVRDAH